MTNQLHAVNITTEADLDHLEARIRSDLRKLKLGDVLSSLWRLNSGVPGIKPFQVAGLAMLAVRFSLPSHPATLVKNYNLSPLLIRANSFFLADPIVFDQALSDQFMRENPAFMILRLVSSQFTYEPGLFGEFARAFYLYDEIPSLLNGSEGIPDFDFHSSFQREAGVSVVDFITTSFFAYSVSKNSFAINTDLFRKARKNGVVLPAQETVRKVLSLLSADKIKYVSLYERRKSSDRRFRMYDFNPILTYPLVKPCQSKQFATADQEHFHAPLPDLIASRISTGIFYDMFNAYSIEGRNVFSEYFGYVFEAYVGKVLNHSIQGDALYSENAIRSFYPSKKGKVPDWILVEDSALILVECKATRFSRAAQSIASEDAINNSLAQVLKGLCQLASFGDACKSRIEELSDFHNHSVIHNILITLETLPLVNTAFFRDHINSQLATKGIRDLDWLIVSIDELEALQPHIATGIKMSGVLASLGRKAFNDVLGELASSTQKSFKDSFLYPKQSELYRQLGVG
jgi:hypothetical protein